MLKLQNTLTSKVFASFRTDEVQDLQAKLVADFTNKVNQKVNAPSKEKVLSEGTFYTELAKLAGLLDYSSEELAEQESVTVTSKQSVDLSTLANICAKGIDSAYIPYFFTRYTELLQDAVKKGVFDGVDFSQVKHNFRVDSIKPSDRRPTGRVKVNHEKVKVLLSHNSMKLLTPSLLPNKSFEALATDATVRKALAKNRRTSKHKVMKGHTSVLNYAYTNQFAMQTFVYNKPFAQSADYMKLAELSCPKALEPIKKSLSLMTNNNLEYVPMHFDQVADRVHRMYNVTEGFTLLGNDAMRGLVLMTINNQSTGNPRVPQDFRNRSSLDWAFISLGNHLGHDKKLFGERKAKAIEVYNLFDQSGSIEAFTNAMKHDDSFKENAVKIVTLCQAIKEHLTTGEEIMIPVELDASFSGEGFMAFLMNDYKCASTSNLLSANGTFVYAYQHILDEFRYWVNSKYAEKDMEVIKVFNNPKVLELYKSLTPKMIKKVIMPMGYGSKASKFEYLGEELGLLFAKFAKERLTGLYNYLTFCSKHLTTHNSPVESWVLPDGATTLRFKTRALFSTIYPFGEKYPITVEIENYTHGQLVRTPNLAANIIHSLDGFMVRQVLMRCNYDVKAVNLAKSLLEQVIAKDTVVTAPVQPAKPAKTLEELSEETGITNPETLGLLNAWRAYNLYGMATVEALYALVNPELYKLTSVELTPASAQQLLDLAKSLLVCEPFNVYTVHDAFACLPMYASRMVQIITKAYYDMSQVPNLGKTLLTSLLGELGFKNVAKQWELAMTNTLKPEYKELILQAEYLVS